MNPLYEKAKDLILIRRTSDNKEFEEYPFTLQPSSLMMTDPLNTIICFPPCELTVGSAISATSSSYATTASFGDNFFAPRVTSSYVSASNTIWAREFIGFKGNFTQLTASDLLVTDVSVETSSYAINTATASIMLDGNPAGLDYTRLKKNQLDLLDGSSVFTVTPTALQFTNIFSDAHTNLGPNELNIDSTNGHYLRLSVETSSFVSASYNFGIGTMTPQQKLHVVGNILCNNITASSIVTAPMITASVFTGSTLRIGTGLTGTYIDSGSGVDTTNLNVKGKLSFNSIYEQVIGTTTLVGGMKFVSSISVASDSVIFLTGQTTSSNAGELSIGNKAVGVGFAITSSNLADNRSIGWFIVENIT